MENLNFLKYIRNFIYSRKCDWWTHHIPSFFLVASRDATQQCGARHTNTLVVLGFARLKYGRLGSTALFKHLCSLKYFNACHAGLVCWWLAREWTIEKAPRHATLYGFGRRISVLSFFAAYCCDRMFFACVRSFICLCCFNKKKPIRIITFFFMGQKKKTVSELTK